MVFRRSARGLLSRVRAMYITAQQRKAQLNLLDILLLGLLSLYVLAGRNAVPFHGDEATFIAMSRDYYELIYERDSDWFEYSGIPVSQYDHYRLIRLTIGPITCLTIGLAWDLDGMTVRDLNGFWNWTTTAPAGATIYDVNEAQGNLPARQLLQTARIPSTLFLVLSAIVVFRVTWRLTCSRLAAYTAILIYATTPAVLINGQRAMQEGAMLLATGLTGFFALRAIEAQQEQVGRRSVPVGWYAGLGVAGGLALASKHSSLLVAMSALLAVFVAPLLRRSRLESSGIEFNWHHICAVTGAALTVIAVFYLLTPAWWSWARVIVLGGLATLLLSLGWKQNDWRIWAMRGVAVLSATSAVLISPAVWPQLVELPRAIAGLRYAITMSHAMDFGTLNSIGQRLAFLLQQAFMARPQYFEVSTWAGIEQIANQIVHYERAGLAGREGGVGWAIGLGMLFASGVWALVTRRFDGRSLLLALWLFLPTLVLLASNSLPWQRYYLCMYPPLAVFCGLGLWKIWQAAVEMQRRTSALSG